VTPALAAVVFLAFLTEATVGFGSTVLTVTLGAHLMPIDALLAAYLPLGLLLSSLLLARSARQVDGRLLLRRALPAIAAGMALGLALLRWQTTPWPRLLFGLFVASLALIELRRLASGVEGPSTPLPRPVELGLLGAGGVIHGLFGSGGPLIVYALSRSLGDRGALRATLAALWWLLNVVLLINYAASGRLGASSLRATLLLLPSLLLGLGAGNWLHHRLPEKPFRWMVYLTLLLAGGSLAVRTFLELA